MTNENSSLKSCRTVIALFAFVVMVACSMLVSTKSTAEVGQLAKPTISCFDVSPTTVDIRVCAGVYGAHAGFNIQWMLASEYALGADGQPGTTDDNTWSDFSLSFCDASFSGLSNCSPYSLDPGVCATVNIGDNLNDTCGASSSCSSQPLQCNTEYVFRAFAHSEPGPLGLRRSDFSSTITCKTGPCGGGDNGCTYTQGYWKTHGPVGCNPSGGTNVWPVDSLALGATVKTADELCAIFKTPAQGDKILQLEHQLIAAKLNIANGADPSSIQSSIDAADALITSGTYTRAEIGALIEALTAYNEGETGPGHCPEEVPE